MLRRAVLSLILVLLPCFASAQIATLIADKISFGGGNIVVAEGNVEILYDGRRIFASKIVYDQANDDLQIDGPITILETESGAVVQARDAELTQDFRTGIVRGARFLLDGQMQLAAVEMNRVNGRYNQLYKAVASSCNVCADGATPLWRIRAERIAHDQVERQLYFDKAWFEVAGVPVLYFPRLRMPDPTLRRASGFLIPELRNSTALGVGFKFPYYLTLGDHADLRLRPYITTKTTTLEARFRKEFTFGSLLVNGAVSSDNLTSNSIRSYLFVEGRFRLPKEFKLNVDVKLASDPSYLLTYDYSDLDRLPSKVEITRTDRDEHISASFESLRSLRANEIPVEDTLASLLGRATYERRVNPGFIGGEARFVFDIEGHERIADTITPALAAACTTAGIAANDCLSRDVLRMGTSMNWRNDWLVGPGVQAAVEGQLSADYYWISQDSNFKEFLGHITPTAAVELRWPMARTTAGGGRDVFEPVVQVAWTDTLGADVPNEDSQLVDLDEGNLLALSRFPGSDQYERGWRTTVGFNWSHLGGTGPEYSATVGKVLRLEDLGQFTAASGLDGGSSDWLVAGQIKMERLTLTNRSLFDDNFNFSKSETQLAWKSDKLVASGSYIWVVDDPAEGRTGDTSELKFNADYNVTKHWTASFNGRYDGNAGEPTDGGLGLSYTNECINVGFTVDRRFTTSKNLTATTDYGLQVSLNGFGLDGRQQARTCGT